MHSVIKLVVFLVFIQGLAHGWIYRARSEGQWSNIRDWGMTCDKPFETTFLNRKDNFDLTYRVNETVGDPSTYTRTCSFFVSFRDETVEYYQLWMHANDGRVCLSPGSCSNCQFEGTTGKFIWRCNTGVQQRRVFIDNLGTWPPQ